MAVSRQAVAASQSLKARSVHIAIQPAPRNIQESRQVLRKLKAHGEITLFRNLRYETRDPSPNTLLVVFQEPEAASKLLSESPMTFTIAPPPPDLGFAVTPESLAIPGLRNTEENKQTKGQDFEIIASPSYKDHAATIRRNSHYWGFGSGQDTFPYEDLSRSVPVPGMSFLDTSPKVLRNSIVQSRMEALKQIPTLRQQWQRGLDSDRVETGDGPANAEKT